MLQKNIEGILGRLRPDSKVLDIGGWASPIHRANYVMDMATYDSHVRNSETHNPHHMMGMPEQFTAETWIQRDICSHVPYPFADNELDFVICSHTLEDIRDPLWVCSEMSRIAKAGYIETPSRLIETCRGVNRDCPVGYYHHRWFVEMDQAKSKVTFAHKNGILFNHWSYSFPRKFLWSLSQEQRVTNLFWEGSFEAEELFSYEKDEIKAELAGYVAKHHPYPEWRFQAEDTWKKVKKTRRSVVNTLKGKK